MRRTPSVTRRVVCVVCFVFLSGCAAPDKQPEAEPDARSATVAGRAEQVEILTGATNRVITLEEFVALQEIENLGPLEPGQKLICRNEKIVGSHFRTYRCFTQDQMRQYEQEARDWLRAAQYWQMQKMR